ncbi:MAG: hypothetical protein BYD32DRAFT_471240, partial [Podila humilis]
MFSDETTISCFWTFGKSYYYSRPNRRRLQPHQVQPTSQRGGGKMMLWEYVTF